GGKIRLGHAAGAEGEALDFRSRRVLVRCERPRRRPGRRQPPPAFSRRLRAARRSVVVVHIVWPLWRLKTSLPRTLRRTTGDIEAFSALPRESLRILESVERVTGDVSKALIDASRSR
ncbi:hypothetical protein, partial [Shinella sp.]|uniref:hypothetical protein n=1 Tax=Shinella sp. TaxID=1870904 RepID=UPI0028965FB6